MSKNLASRFCLCHQLSYKPQGVMLTWSFQTVMWVAVG